MDKPELEIKIARTDEEIDVCFPVMSELRPHLERAEFLRTIRRMQAAGYELVSLSVGAEPVAVPRYRIQTMLCSEPFLYVDDMVTRAAERSQGYGAVLLEWLKRRAREKGCNQLHLDSGVAREDAHRFYTSHGMVISGFHFRVDVPPQ